MLKITLQEMGDARIFSDEEIRNLEEVFQEAIGRIQGIMEEHVKAAQAAGETEEMQADGEPHEVNIATINRSLFEEKREDQKQEMTRLLILEAFAEADKNPAYAAFSTVIPKKTWEVKTAGQLDKISQDWGGHTADWREQALEFAQRISNGESWEDICNKADTLDWYRMVWWKNGRMRLVGGSRENSDKDAPADFGAENWHAERRNASAVPLIVIPKKREG